MKRLIMILVLALAGTTAYAQTGAIDNVIASQRTDGTGIVDITFDLVGTAANLYHIVLEVRFNNGGNYVVIPDNHLSGSLMNVEAGIGHQVEWDGLASHPNTYSEETIVKIIANLIDDAEPGSVTDIDGNEYVTIKIGQQEWMASDLKVTRYLNGDSIPTGLDNEAWAATNEGAYAVYPHESIEGIDSEEEMVAAYARLYNWQAVVDERGICPDGWHVPSDAEWSQLTDFLIANYADITAANVGVKLKSCRYVNSPLGEECSTTEHPRWNEHAVHYGTDDFGFGALAGGTRSWTSGIYNFLGRYGGWWSSTEDNNNAWRRGMDDAAGSVGRFSSRKNNAYNVRCIRPVN